MVVFGRQPHIIVLVEATGEIRIIALGYGILILWLSQK
jgi:hypothetical protein